MAASTNDKISQVTSSNTARPVVSSLSAPGHAIGETSIGISVATNWPTVSKIHFAIYTTTTVGSLTVKDTSTQTDWTGTLSGTTISNMVLTGGTDGAYSAGAIVEITPTARMGKDLYDWAMAEHAQDGTHKAITATSLSVSGTTALTGALTIKSYDGWVNTADTWVYVSATSFKITGSDVTAKFPVGTKIKLTQTTVKYFYVTSATFSTDTTVNITGGSDYTLANAAITSPALSYDSTPQGFPQFFNFTTTWTNVSVGNGTLTGRFAMFGREVRARIKLVFGSTTSVSGDNIFTAPVTLSTDQGVVEYILGRGVVVDTGTSTTPVNVGPAITDTTKLQLYHEIVNGNYPVPQAVQTAAPSAGWAAGDIWIANFTYEAA